MTSARRATVQGRTEPWDRVFAQRLNDTLDEAAVALSDIVATQSRRSRREPPRIGILPAVYFPRLRMGSVVYTDWGQGAADVLRAFPWKRSRAGFLPPPFTCFAPPVGLDERAFLITDVARVIDAIGSYEASERALLRITTKGNGRHVVHSRALNAFAGASSWTANDGTASIVDAYLLKASGVQATTCVFLFPSTCELTEYVPLLYIQHDKIYDTHRLQTAVLETLRLASRADPLVEAMRAASDAARLCATRWLNPKTGLLNQSGFNALKEDLQRRVAIGELYAEFFFDIDRFKSMNDLLGYDGADQVARALADRVLFFLQRDAASGYAEHRLHRTRPGHAHSTPPNGFHALLAHVSGDEFKVFVQTNATRAHLRALKPRYANHALGGDLTAVVDLADGIVESAAGRRVRKEATEAWEHRHQHAFRQACAMRPQGLAVPATVSLGIALLDPVRSDLPPFAKKPRPYPMSKQILAPYRRGLNDLDHLAERAIDGAKHRGRDQAMFSDALFFEGAAILERMDSGRVRLNLGSIDGLRAGTRFDVLRRGAGGTPVPVAALRVEEVHEREAQASIIGPPPDTLEHCWLSIASGKTPPLPVEQFDGGGRCRVLGRIPRGPMPR